MVRRVPTLARQAALETENLIRSGALAGDDGMLPSELVLSLRLGVSRATLREALSQLERDGLIVRRQGVGTFVDSRRPVMETGLEELESIETLARRIGVEIHMGDHQVHQRAATPWEAESLQLPPGVPILDVERVMTSGESPIAFLVDVVPIDVLDLEELGVAFQGSVLDLLLRRRNPPVERSYTELSAQAAGRALGRRLHLHAGSPILKFTAQLFAVDGRVVDSSVSYFLPGHFRFHVIRQARSGALSAAGLGSGRDPHILASPR
jgi:GntR family transcriptional regulator